GRVIFGIQHVVIGFVSNVRIGRRSEFFDRDNVDSNTPVAVDGAHGKAAGAIVQTRVDEIPIQRHIAIILYAVECGPVVIALWPSASREGVDLKRNEARGTEAKVEGPVIHRRARVRIWPVREVTAWSSIPRWTCPKPDDVFTRVIELEPN